MTLQAAVTGRLSASPTTRLKQIFDAVDIKLSAKEVNQLERPYRQYPIVGHEQAQPAKLLNLHRATTK